MKKITIICVMAMLCLNFGSKAQGLAEITIPIKLGEKLPASFWQQEHDFYANGKLTRQNLETYKGKLLILDFFATWCTTCINKLSKMEELQKANGNKLVFLLVNSKNTGDTPEKITALSARLKLQMLNTSLVNDSLLNKLFPHRTIPTYVWIDEHGICQAITNSTLLNQMNIDAILEKEITTTKTISKPKTAGK